MIFYSPFNTTSQVKKIESIENLQRWPLYVFGDSLYDTGMGFYVDKGPAADSYPYAQFANLPFPEPYRSPNLTDYTKSVNFADAAAGVLVDGRNNTLNLKLQTEFFVEMVGKMEKQYGKEKTRKVVSNAVLLFNIGSNDYVDIWIKVPRPHNASFVNSFVNKILGNFTVSVTSMYNQGARKFAFQNYGPMGCLPLFLQDSGNCAEDLSELAKLHNDRFAALAKTWARRLPGLQYIIYDFYTSLTSHIVDGAKYGFKETQTACCGSGRFNKKFTCMEKANFTLCDDIPSHLFFDPAHPTEEGDRQFAVEFWNGPPSLVTPTNLKSLFGR
ncbi:hypothetical protein KSS87_021042 [Heliosperma pusillum]|nr:hypothetical protein KSS87_021042 [Heliosperma pusillum]